VGFPLAAAAALSSCTTFMHPVTCSGGAFHCGPASDVRFCESVALVVEGTDCTTLGLAPHKRFCFVSRTQCVSTTYAVKDRDCRIVRYEPLKDWSECSEGTPTFAGTLATSEP
jgi:hypothetical protein